MAITSGERTELDRVLADISHRTKIRMGATGCLIASSFLFFASFTFLNGLPQWVPFLIRAAGASFMTAGLGGLVLPLLIPPKDELKEFLKQDVLEGIQKQREALHAEAKTLGALNDAGVMRVYRSRGEASADVLAAIKDPNLTHLSVMGVSLTDFFRDRGPFADSWKCLQQRLIEGSKAGQQLSVRFLFVDPGGTGARLRADHEQGHYQPGSLADDVRLSARMVVECSKKELVNASLEARLYRLMPHSFVLITDRYAFIQPYFFWSADNYGRHAPLLKVGLESPLLEEVRGHLELIWDKASCPVTDLLEAHAVGIDQGAHDTGMVNIYSNPSSGSRRMEWILQQAMRLEPPRGTVRVQGISLRRFFRRDSDALHPYIEKLAEERQIQVLMLDPYCREAKFRSFLEDAYGGSFDDYLSNPAYHRESKLVRDITETMAEVERLRKVGAKIELRLYGWGPSFFLLLTEDRALVEQYQYGSRPSINPMPLLEFEKDAPACPGSTLWSDNGGAKDRLGPHRLLADHYKHAWKTAYESASPAAAAAEDLSGLRSSRGLPAGAGAPLQPRP